MGKRRTSADCISIPRTPSSPQDWQAGLEGVAIEVVTGSHTPDQFQSYARYAQRYGLLASTGSDSHAPRRAIATWETSRFATRLHAGVGRVEAGAGCSAC